MESMPLKADMLVVLILVCFVTTLHTLCPKCDPSLCPSTQSCNISTLDECACCHVCVRGIDEKCGGAYGKYGVCQKGLECILVEESEKNSQFTGVCKDDAGQPDCDRVACPPITFDCPWDSKYTPGKSSNNSCCQIPGKCECDLTRCNNVVCPPKYTKKLQSAAANSPGECCEMYECLPEKTLDDVCVDPQTGLKYQAGEYWRRDECTPCTCFAGAPRCYNYPCQRLACAHPIKPAEECCPTCPGKTECGAFKCDLDCQGSYVADDRACPLCQCSVNNTCAKVDTCQLECPNGFQTGSDGCEKCECHVCHNIMKHCPLTCGYGYAKDSKGCPLCKCKADSQGNTIPPEKRRCYDIDNGEVHEEDETWQPNPCTSCTCFNGIPACSIFDCDHRECDNPIQIPGQCCPECKDGCLDEEKNLRSEHETWTDECKECSCNNGTIQCSPVSCPLLPCTESVIIPGKCCPVCPTVMQNIVTEEERDYVVVVAAAQDLHTMLNRKAVFLQHLSNGNDYTFTLKLLFSSNLELMRSNDPGKLSREGSIALVNAVDRGSKIPADKVVSKLEARSLALTEPDVVDIMTYQDYLALSKKSDKLKTHSKISVGSIVAIAIASVVIAVMLIVYAVRRYMILSHRRQFKHTASMGQSADQLIHAVDNNRLTINFNRPRPSVDSMLTTSPTPSDVSPTHYHPVTGHDNLASSYNPLSNPSSNPSSYNPLSNP